MDYYQKVLWGEGMLLTPQHLQQGDRYLENLVQRRLRGIQAYDWGLCTLEIDRNLLAEGQFGISECSGVMPDGLWFEIPAQDETPAPRPIGPQFPADISRLGAYLAIPRSTAGEVTCLLNGDSGGTQRATTYQGRLARIRDDTNSAREQEIYLAGKRLQIRFDGELEGYTTIKIADLVRNATGAFEIDPAFIPPSLYISASSGLTTLLQRVLGILAQKSADLAGQRRERSRGLAEFTTSEGATFWFLHTINSHIPLLSNLFHQPRAHPQLLYREMATLAGELYTFAAEGSPTDVPIYKHEELSGTFTTLVAQLRVLLGTVLPTKCVPIPLEKKSDAMYVAQMRDDRFVTSHLYLGVKANLPAERISQEFPMKAKISSSDRVEQLIVQAMHGLQIRHLPTPPSEIPIQPGKLYFQLAQTGEHWEAIKKSRTLALYAPVEFQGLDVELIAVKG